MNFNFITGNPTITKQANGKYQVLYAQPPIGKIKNFTDLTLEEVKKLPFVNPTVLALLN
ncbi:MAG: hypothetical protein J6B94_06775 [Lachnospiraceae bacterium]|nr:hypothetical protein [Lachnospiraceae bacterium]